MALTGMGGRSGKSLGTMGGNAASRNAANRAKVNSANGQTILNRQQLSGASPTSYDSGSYSGGGGSYGGGGGMAAAVAPPPRLSDAEWLAADSGYNSQLAALEQKLRDFEVENTSAREKGTQEYDNSLLRLGWMKPTEEGGVGSWNRDDRSTGYGNAYQSQMGDFASRGMLQSTLYDQAMTDMLGNFNRQKSDMDTAQTNFLEELARALAEKKSDTQLGKDQARVDALARRAAQESGLG